MPTTQISERLLTSMVRARKQAGLTQSAMAAILGVVPSTINKVERERRNTTVAALEDWADACGGQVLLSMARDRTLHLDHLDDADFRMLSTLAAVLPKMSMDARAGVDGIINSLSKVVSAVEDPTSNRQENVTKRRD